MAHVAPLPPRGNGVACTINPVPTFQGIFFGPFFPSILQIQLSQLVRLLKVISLSEDSALKKGPAVIGIFKI